MSRRSRSQRQRSARQRTAAPQAQRAVTTPPRRQKGPADRMALYRVLASPGTPMRLVFIAGLLLLSLSQIAVASPSNPPRAWQVAGLIGAACILAFVTAGMMRHFRAIYRIRRDEPGAWQTSMGFAFASLGVPLGLSGPVQSPRDRLLRTVTIVLVVLYVIGAVLSANRQH